ncbi:MAG: methyltransferase C-terminal domain-containing protein [Sporichthyaceae bacterium]
MTKAGCRGCGSEDTVQVLDLGLQPGSDHFPLVTEAVVDERWPLELWLCETCALVQLGPVSPRLPEPALAVESATSRAHAAASVAEILGSHRELVGGTVYEFASHHGGSWLDHLTSAGCRVAAGDASADLVIDVHALPHEPQLSPALALRAARLAPRGLLVLEFHHLLPLFLGSQFDTVRHGHWSYLSLTALRGLADRHGLRVLSAHAEPVFGGSLRVALVHASTSRLPDDTVQPVLDSEAAAGLTDAARLVGLQDAALHASRALHAHLESLRASGQVVLGYGAPSKAAVLLGVSEIGPDLLPFTVDAAVAKHGRRIPACGVPIRPVEDLRTARPDVVLVLTWDIVDEVMEQLEAGGGWGASYLVPFPEPHPVGR